MINFLLFIHYLRQFNYFLQTCGLYFNWANQRKARAQSSLNFSHLMNCPSTENEIAFLFIFVSCCELMIYCTAAILWCNILVDRVVLRTKSVFTVTSRSLLRLGNNLQRYVETWQQWKIYQWMLSFIVLGKTEVGVMREPRQFVALFYFESKFGSKSDKKIIVLIVQLVEVL